MNVNARAKGGRVGEQILKRQMWIALWKQNGDEMKSKTRKGKIGGQDRGEDRDTK